MLVLPSVKNVENLYYNVPILPTTDNKLLSLMPVLHASELLVERLDGSMNSYAVLGDDSHHSVIDPLVRIGVKVVESSLFASFQTLEISHLFVNQLTATGVLCGEHLGTFCREMPQLKEVYSFSSRVVDDREGFGRSVCSTQGINGRGPGYLEKLSYNRHN